MRAADTKMVTILNRTPLDGVLIRCCMSPAVWECKNVSSMQAGATPVLCTNAAGAWHTSWPPAWAP